MCVCTSNAARPGSSATSLSSQGRMRSSENTWGAYPWDGAAKESNLPSGGLLRPNGFEGRVGHQTPAAPGSMLRRGGGTRSACAQEEVARFTFLVTLQREAADHRHEQALGVHVAGVHLDRIEVAVHHGPHLRLVPPELAAVGDWRPARVLEVLLAVADELREVHVELPEVAVEADHGHRLVGVVESRSQLAGGRVELRLDSRPPVGGSPVAAEA